MRGAIEGDRDSHRLTTASLGAIKAPHRATRTTRTTSIMSGRRVGTRGVVKGVVKGEVEEVEEVAVVATPITTATLLLGVVQGDDEQEAQFSGGAGLYAARVRMCQEFVLVDNTRIKVRTAREDAADERQEQEGGETEGAQ